MADLLVQKGFSVKRAAKDGQAALTLHVIPSSFVFETDDKGKIQSTTLNANKGNIYLFNGLKSIKPDTVSVRPYNCNASVNGNVLSFDSINPNQVCGKVEITATYKGQTRTAIAEFYVSKQRWNDAEFTTIKGKFESIQEEFERVDGEITDTKSTINQLPEKITFEVLRHENGINLLKGGSLAYPELLELRNHPEYITINNYGNLCKKSITLKRGYVGTDDHTVAYFPRQTLKANTDYTISCWVRSDGYLYISCPLRYTFDGPPIDWVQAAPPNTNGKYQHFEFTFNTGVNTFAHFYLSARRNVNATVTDLQLEEGKKATSWTNPDKYERFRRAGIDLDLERIILQANKVYTKNSKGETTSLVDEEGNFKASSLQTFDNGKEGHIIIKGNTEAYYKPGLQHPSRWIGYEAGEWVERMYDDNGNLIWEDGKFGKQFKMRPEQWETIAERYISTHSDLKALFSAYTSNTLKQIFIDSRQIQKEVEKYTAARDARGNLIASDTTDYTTAKQRDGKVFIRGLAFNGLNGLRSNNLSGLGGTIGEIGGTIGEIGGGLSPTLPTSNVTPFTGFIKASEANKVVPQKPDTSHMTIQEEKIALDFFYKTLVPHWYTRIREEYSLQNVYNVRFREGVPYYFVKVLQYQDGVLINTFTMYANEEDAL